MVRIAASSNGDVKKLAAACETWCSAKSSFEAGMPSFFVMWDFTHSLSLIQRCIDSRNTADERGNVAIAVSSIRSNFTNGFS
jgi:hypothetical protein